MRTMAKPKLHPVIDKLLKLRKLQRLSQREFAKKLHIGLSTLRKWEQGVAVPDPTTLQFISMYLDSLGEEN